MIARADAILTQAHETVQRIAEVTAAAETAVGRAGETLKQARAIVARVEALDRQVSGLLAALRPLAAAVGEMDPDVARALTQAVTRLQPLLSSLADIRSEAPGDAAELVRKGLPLLSQFESNLVPLLAEIRAAVPDVRGILPVVQRLEPAMADVEARIAGLPGGKRLRERGERVIEDLREQVEADADEGQPG
jgi:ABC-type transporter Mla subunit MlaD